MKILIRALEPGGPPRRLHGDPVTGSWPHPRTAVYIATLGILRTDPSATVQPQVLTLLLHFAPRLVPPTRRGVCVPGSCRNEKRQRKQFDLNRAGSFPNRGVALHAVFLLQTRADHLIQLVSWFSGLCFINKSTQNHGLDFYFLDPGLTPFDVCLIASYLQTSS